MSETDKDYSKLLICFSVHECPEKYKKDCYHAKPHESNYRETCGPSMECWPAKILSGCTKLSKEGTYKRTVMVSCPHCGKGMEKARTFDHAGKAHL